MILWICQTLVSNAVVGVSLSSFCCTAPDISRKTIGWVKQWNWGLQDTRKPLVDPNMSNKTFFFPINDVIKQSNSTFACLYYNPVEQVSLRWAVRCVGTKTDSFLLRVFWFLSEPPDRHITGPQVSPSAFWHLTKLDPGSSRPELVPVQVLNSSLTT